MNRSIYLERYSYGPPLITKPPDAGLEMIVVIPCYFEPDLITTLQSLANCTPTKGKVEVIVIVNESIEDTLEVKKFNRQTIEKANQWVSLQTTGISFFLLHQILPDKHSGVGLARKVGMDEATRRFQLLGKEGVIACLDADCTCSTNYLEALESHFDKNKNTPGCSIYYEHPLCGNLSDEIYQAITTYELHLRYYTQALAYSELPCAFQTVGSSMAVRSSAYEKQGGMNKRKAGEDFYFLQKIMKIGGFTELRSAIVFPSSRLSTRVPFGTGKAIIDSINSNHKSKLTYSPQIFIDLKSIASNVDPLYQASSLSIKTIWKEFSKDLQSYITIELFDSKIRYLNQNTKSKRSFRRRFFHWCDGFFAFKYANYASSHLYPKVEISKAAAWLLKETHGIELNSNNLSLLLEEYRKLDSSK